MLTKVTVEDAQLAAVVAPLGQVAASLPLSGGMFATTLKVTLTDGREVVVKVTDADWSRFLRYEYGLLATEARIYRDLAGSGVPVPTVLLEDFSRTHLPADVVVASLLPGTMWYGSELDETATRDVVRHLGAVMADVHRVSGPRFGYPAPEAEISGDTWPEAFGAMVEAILADAVRWEIDLPARQVRNALIRHQAALEAVTHPVVVHHDLWAGNVLIDDEHRIVGITDTERTLWGDPLMDLIGYDQFGGFLPDPALIAGNTAAGGVLEAELASPTGAFRFALYRLYFSLLLVTEVVARGYEGDGAVWHATTARGILAESLDRLEG